MTAALILLGHGSHVSPNTAGIVWQYVDELRQRGVADEVAAAFWKEAPGYRTVLNSVRADDVVLVPVFIAQGYFTQQVIPAEFGLDGEVTQQEGRLIRYARTLGEHPTMAGIIRGRVMQAIDAFDVDPQKTVVSIIGHGTKRNPNSRVTTLQQVDQLNTTGLVARVQAVYLDDNPSIPSLYHTTTEPVIIAVPFFLAEGSHTSIDVPRALGLAPGQNRARLNGRDVIYTPPIGVDERIPELIVDLATATGFPCQARDPRSPWQHYPQAGLALFSEKLRRAGSLTIGQLEVTQDFVKPVGEPLSSNALSSPTAIRETVRTNPLRPWATSADLPGDWHAPVTSTDEAFAVVETIYPGLIADWAVQQRGQLRKITLRTVSERQVGMFQRLLDLTPTEVSDYVEAVCGTCVRIPTWHTETESILPCQEPCNWWMSHAKPKEKMYASTQ